jgi:glycosyltransferase involved in cell wall biosynthesis
MITGSYYPEMNGASNQCRQLVRVLSDQADFAVLTTTRDRALPRSDRVDGIAVRRVFVDVSGGAPTLRALWPLMRAFLRLVPRARIVHLHGFSRKTVLLIVLARLLARRVVVKMTSIGHDDPLSVRRRSRPSFWLLSRADLVLAVSPGLEAAYRQAGLPAARLRLIPNGVDLDRFRPAADAGEVRQARHAVGLPEPGPIVLFVGHFSREKCPDVLYDAWRRSGAAAGALVFIGSTMAGRYEVEPGLAEAIRAGAARAGVADRIIFVEQTANIETYYRSASMFVLPSLREGLPNALLEAMACGLPCIASRLAGVTDAVIEHAVNGLLVAPGDAGALAAAIDLLLADPDRGRSLAVRARDTIRQRFSLRATAEQSLAAYRELEGR